MKNGNVTRPDLDVLVAQLENIARRGDSYSENGGFFIDDEDAASCRAAAAALAAERARADQAAEKAWDEGYMAVPAEPEDREFFVEDAPNPYRAASAAEQ